MNYEHDQQHYQDEHHQDHHQQETTQDQGQNTESHQNGVKKGRGVTPEDLERQAEKVARIQDVAQILAGFKQENIQKRSDLVQQQQTLVAGLKETQKQRLQDTAIGKSARQTENAERHQNVAQQLRENQEKSLQSFQKAQ
ncbi:MAG: hypothetical protein O4861_21575, partial [Trichodesmium sp. St16_bin4-tuft]|nr:hypothetical protein [Trichodesmium sp. St4_bin8_1]MDE5079126.1 hypothetical protein [Trichodesmium sp. St2_bin6]MDE5091206.1 hypothetical protein [Trichodesmium sp. St18_bin3_1_1]MDE5100779.1 hypothetical protein [Trichodesmium sp. St16_bin4-tuft]